MRKDHQYSQLLLCFTHTLYLLCTFSTHLRSDTGANVLILDVPAKVKHCVISHDTKSAQIKFSAEV